MNKKTFLSNTCEAQRARLVEALELAGAEGITSHHARMELDIYYPPARVKELRQLGWHIETLWELIETDLGQHRVARYVLLSRPRRYRKEAA